MMYRALTVVSGSNHSKLDRSVLSGRELPKARQNAKVTKLTKKEINQQVKIRRISKSHDTRKRKNSPLFSTRGPG